MKQRHPKGQVWDLALFKAAALAGRALGLAVDRLWTKADPVSHAEAARQEQALQTKQAEETLVLLHARLSRITPRKRPDYLPHERFRVLALQQFWGWTNRETARRFVLSESTIHTWRKAVEEQHPANDGPLPDKGTIGTLVKPDPPLQRYADVVRSLVQLLDRAGFSGCRSLAAHLARAGIKISRETVRRYRSEPPRPFPPSCREKVAGARKSGPHVTAQYPNHVWMTDLTTIHGLFRLFSWRLVTVFDVYSRFPLVWRLFKKEPTAEDLVRLLDEARSRHGEPRHFISDRGSQFTSDDMKGFTTKHQIRHRFGAIGKHGSIALIERFWRTLKGLMQIHARPPLTEAALLSRLEASITYYAKHRPHSSLRNKTPFEVFNQLAPPNHTLNPVLPPRQRDGPEAWSRLPRLQIRSLHPDLNLSILERDAA